MTGALNLLFWVVLPGALAQEPAETPMPETEGEDQAPQAVENPDSAPDPDEVADRIKKHTESVNEHQNF